MAHRKQMRRIDHSGTARFLTFSCYRRLPLLRNPAIADAFVDSLCVAVSRHPVRLLAWVVMPEHVHLVLFPSETEPLEPFLTSLKRPFARRVIARWRALNAPVLKRLQHADGTHRFWQYGGEYDRNVIGPECVEKIRYCHANPITRGLVARSIDWPHSSARAYEQRDDYRGPPIDFDLDPETDADVT
jgi:putative transposase